MKTRKSCLIIAGLFGLVILSLPVLFLGIRYLVFASRQAARPSLQILSPGINETVKVHNPIHVQDQESHLADLVQKPFIRYTFHHCSSPCHDRYFPLSHHARPRRSS